MEEHMNVIAVDVSKLSDREKLVHIALLALSNLSQSEFEAIMKQWRR